MDPTELTQRSNHARKLCIEFLGPDEVDRWPKSHQKLFADVQKLGRERFSSFMETKVCQKRD
ncbi:uncharacterized protein N7496_010250 [Penicillium cataractarum]|uniref:Uncharacterized protein n=1 Tax=Penicillium cataractarum TaxID=2100454 RepID=A0A9W9RQH0_9EURO|nr:uncharacterized protein N7496_010250 [Penicillium cataractarum]KAJ5364537.1 hypothetical protein N7496_010250 [Penicillium cataractarum]